MEDYPKMPPAIIAWHQEVERQRKEWEQQIPLYVPAQDPEDDE